MLSRHLWNKFTEIIMSRKFTEDPQNSGLFQNFQNLRSWTQIIRARSSLRVVRSSQSCPNSEAWDLAQLSAESAVEAGLAQAWCTSCCSCLEMTHPQGNHSDQRRSSQQVSRREPTSAPCGHSGGGRRLREAASSMLATRSAPTSLPPSHLNSMHCLELEVHRSQY